MALHPAPIAILPSAMVLSLAVAAFTAWRHRPAGRGTAAAALSGLVVTLASALALVSLFPDRYVPLLVGLALGAVVGFFWEWAWPDADAPPTGKLGTGVAAIATLGLAFGDPVALANALAAMLLGWAIWPLSAGMRGERESSASGLAVVAGLAGAAAWGEKLFTGAAFGVPIAVALGTALVVSLAIAEVTKLGRSLAGAIAALLFAIAAVGLVAGLYGQGAPLAIAVVAGAILGALGPVLAEREEAPLGALAVLVLGGALLVVDNRLFGVVAMGLGAAGIGCGMLQRGRAREVLTLVAAIFAARVWLQLFLDRTLLTAYGVDLTHPYAFAALVAGGLLPLAAMLVARLVRPDAALTAAWAAFVIGLPVWIGYFIHVEALGSLLAGVLLAAFVIGLLPEGAGPLATETRRALPAVLIAAIATTLLATPWLVTVMNATRQARLVALAAGLAVLAVGLIYWWVRVSRRSHEPVSS